MGNRADRRAALRERMQNDAKRRDEGGRNYRPLFDFSEYENVNRFKAKKGKNEIDILPFEVTTKNDPTGTAIGNDNYKLEYWRHTNIGPNNDMVLCLKATFGKPCSICEEKQKMLDGGADWKDAEVDALHAKRRCIYNMIDLNDTEKGVQLFDQSHFKFENPLFGAAEYKNPDFVCFADIEEGYTVTFRGSEETFAKKKFIEPKDFDFEEREPYEEDIYDEVYPLDAILIVPTYEEVQALFMGVEIEDEKEESPKKEKATSTRKKKTPTSNPRTSAKEARETPERGSRRKKKAEPEEEQIPDASCPNDLVIGKDWDTNDVCQDCEDGCYADCEAEYKKLEALKKAEEAEKKKETPTRRKRRR